MGVRLGPTLQTSASQREHVDQPAGTAGDVPGAEEIVDVVVSVRSGVSEVVFTDLEQER